MEEFLLQTIIDGKKQAVYKRKALISTLIDLLVTFVIVGLLMFVIFGFAIVDGNSMYPTLRDGDIVMFYRLNANYEADDIVVFKLNGERYIKRVVAREGDIVDIDNESGYLIVNGSVMSEGILFPTRTNNDVVTYPYTIPTGHVFVLGDNRENSVDSRKLGAISTDAIFGKVMLVLRTRVF